jgi:anaerobic magnesium-protoporphyrin IX monomethyl ester cyclase
MRAPQWMNRWQSGGNAWLDLGDLGAFMDGGPMDQWQDHGIGLLRTIMQQHGLSSSILSTRAVRSWDKLAAELRGYDTLLMNVRSYTYPIATKAAKLFKEQNPQGRVIVGGMHATVALDEMVATKDFDLICRGPGENLIVDLVRNSSRYPRVVTGVGAKSMADWTKIDRTLWPKPPSRKSRRTFPWPLEPACGWGPPPVATILTNRVCPWQCSFCSENSYIENMGRPSVTSVINELNELDRRYGVGSVVIHDSMFFQNPRWLTNWIQDYPTRANKVWTYWAAGRADTVRQWPDLFESLVKETNWMTISIGFESGSDRVLRILNKECTEEDNNFTIDLLNRIGDEQERSGKPVPRFWANVMLGIPGETREDAFKTMRMLKRMRYVIPSISYFSPYPGSALGYQLIAEGKSLMSKDNYHRFPSDEKVAGIDYAFYRDLLLGQYDDEVNRGLTASEKTNSGGSIDALVKA